MRISRGSVRTYLAGLRDVALIPGVTEHTRREPLVQVLKAAARELGIGAVTVHAELRMADVGQPDLQVGRLDGRADRLRRDQEPRVGHRFRQDPADRHESRIALDQILSRPVRYSDPTA